MTIRTKTVYETDDAEKFDTVNEARQHGRRQVWNDLIATFLALPVNAQLNEWQRSFLQGELLRWEKQRLTDVEIQALIDAKNTPAP